MVYMKIKYLCGLLLVLIIFTSCTHTDTFETNDEEYDIYYEVDKVNNLGIIMLHSYKGNSNEWDSLWGKIDNATKARMDFRGHGKSTGTIDFLSEEDISRFTTDVKMLKSTLKAFHNVTEYVLIGSSLGANVAVKSAINDKYVKALVLISPGEMYKDYDIRTDYEIIKIPVLAISSKKDFYSFRTVEKMAFENLDRIYVDGNEHGVDVLDSETKQKIVDFVKKVTNQNID